METGCREGIGEREWRGEVRRGVVTDNSLALGVIQGMRMSLPILAV